VRFLFIGQGYPGAQGTSWGSGVGTYLREITLGLRDRGHSCHALVWRGGTGPSEQVVDGVTVHLLDEANWSILERLIPERSDVHHMRAVVRKLHRRHAYDWIELQSEEGLGIGVLRDHPDRTILRVHTTLAQMVKYKDVNVTSKVKYRLAREDRSFRLARRVSVTTDWHRERLESAHSVIGTVSVVPIGIRPPARSGFDRQDGPEPPTFLVVGSADLRKGFDRIRGIIEVYGRQHGPCKIVIVSRCSEEKKERFNLLRPFPDGITVEWRSDLDEMQLAATYEEARVLLHPARYESFGLPLVEAAAREVPVVATRVGVASTLLDGELSRFLVDGDDPGEFAAAMALAVSDAGDAGRMLRKKYEELYTRERMVDSYLADLAEQA